MKRCSSCNEIKDDFEFRKSKRNKTGLHSYCNECSKIKARQWRAKNPLAASKSSKAWREKNPILSKHLSAKWTNNNKYKVAILTAKRRNLDFTLSEIDYHNLKTSDCYYCGSTENIGIDRVDNSKGYTPDNSKPCCTWCNKMKLDKSKLEFIEHIKRILINIGEI